MLPTLREIGKVFGAWASVHVGHFYIPPVLLAFFSYISLFSWLSNIWILGALSPDITYYFFSGAVMWAYFKEGNWRGILLIVALTEVIVNMYDADFFSFFSNFEKTEDHADEYLLNVTLGYLIPGFLIPFGAFCASWLTVLIGRLRTNASLIS